MKSKDALSMLYRMAAQSNGGRNERAARQYVQIIKADLGKTDEPQLKSLTAERTELQLRVLELEEELAEAKKPKRRAPRRKKKTDADTTTDDKGS